MLSSELRVGYLGFEGVRGLKLSCKSLDWTGLDVAAGGVLIFRCALTILFLSRDGYLFQEPFRH